MDTCLSLTELSDEVIDEIKVKIEKEKKPDWNIINSSCLQPSSHHKYSSNKSTNIKNISKSNSVISTSSLESISLNSETKIENIDYLLSVSVAESVTAGALSNTLCSEPGSSKFFLGGIIAYNMDTQKKLLDVDEKYAELNNFANPFTTYTMAKNVTNIFNSRIGISTTGFSLPMFRPADLENDKCEINVDIPYAYICIYDALLDKIKIYKLSNDLYTEDKNQKIQRAQMQAKIAIKSKILFEEYCMWLYKRQNIL
jgi:hypothetical protein